MNAASLHWTLTYYVILVTLCVALVCQGSQDFLFYSSLGDDTHTAGLYGGPVSHQKDGRAGNMHLYGFDCVSFQSEVRTDVPMDWFDIDENSGKMLFRLHDEDQRLTLVVAPICHKEPFCRNETQDVRFNDFTLPPLKVMGPIAYYHDTVYFIYYDIEKPNDVKTSRIQLRKFKGCEDRYPVTTASLFTIEDCSELIATIKEEEYEHYQGFKTLDNLHVYGSGSSPSFLVQVMETKYEGRRRSQVCTILTHVSGNGQVEFLHSQPISDLGYFAYELRQLGGISLRDGKVCWAAIDRVLCGDLDGTSLSNVKTTLPTEDVSLACQADSEPKLTNIVTGVAIAESDFELAFYFGCLAQIKNFGGAGLVRVPRSGSVGTVSPLQENGNTQVFAGTLQLTKHCHQNPSQGAEVIQSSTSGQEHLRDSILLGFILLMFPWLV